MIEKKQVVDHEGTTLGAPGSHTAIRGSSSLYAMGNETEVYCTDDRRYVVKLKSHLGGATREAIDEAKTMRAAAEQFADCIGPQHSIESYYVVSRDGAGRAQVLVVQPFIAHARPLDAVHYSTLSPDERTHVAAQLRMIIRRSLRFYRSTGCMPDLYGRSSISTAERERQRSLKRLPSRLWSFLVKRSLLRSHNLLLTDAAERRIVLVDYDIVRRSRLYRRLYYAVRWLLFWRDQALIQWMRFGARIPRPSRRRLKQLAVVTHLADQAC